MTSRRPTIKEIREARRKAHRLVAEKLSNETFYQASSLVMQFVRSIINDHRQKGEKP